MKEVGREREMGTRCLTECDVFVLRVFHSFT